MGAETVGDTFCALRQGKGAPALPEKPRDAQHAAFQAVIEQIRPVLTGAAPWPLFFFGPAGCGKTCAAVILLDFAGGMFFTVADWIERMTDALCGRLRFHSITMDCAILPSEAREEMAKANLIVLDELGFNLKPSEHEVREVHRVLLARENRPLVVISNYGLKNLGRGDRYGDTVASRLNGGTVVEFPDVDYRAKKGR